MGAHRRAGLAFVVAGMLVSVSVLSASTTAVAQPPHPTPVGRAPQLPAGSTADGTAALAPSMTVDVVLSPRDPAGLQSLAGETSRPGSEQYRTFLTPAQVHARFGPRTEDVDAVVAWLQSQHLMTSLKRADGLVVAATGSPAQVGRAFGTTIGSYRLVGGRHVYANSSAPDVPARLRPAITGVVGLNNLFTTDPLVTPAKASGTPKACSATSKAAKKDKAYTYDQLAKAYGIDTLLGAGHRGGGRTIGLLELDGWSTRDVAAFQKCYGTKAAVDQVDVDGGAPATNQGEATLDIETAIALAPEADVLVYNAGKDSDVDQLSAILDEYVQILNDDRVDVLSISYGGCEADVLDAGSDFPAIENLLFQEAALEGITVLASSGDSGSEGCGGRDTSLSVSDPASQPFVTGVGGTTLTKVKGPKETAWRGSGGGVSSFWPMPAWQSGRGVVAKDSSGAPCGSTTYCREVPDVSASADPGHGYDIYLGGRWVSIGGTSAAAPLWAALVADVLSVAADHDARLGFLNPLLYATAATAKKAPFHDVTSGDNDRTRSHGKTYKARKGYDMVTGLGTPDAARLVGPLNGVTSQAVRFTAAAGTNPPPERLGPYVLRSFPADSCEPDTGVDGVDGPRHVTFSTTLECRQVGSGWATWSHGYDGVVYVMDDHPAAFSTVTLTLPPGTKAFSFYAEPDEFQTFDLQATEASGATSGPLQVYGESGAQFYGFYAQGSASITSITISCDTEFAVGELGTD